MSSYWVSASPCRFSTALISPASSFFMAMRMPMLFRALSSKMFTPASQFWLASSTQNPTLRPSCRREEIFRLYVPTSTPESRLDRIFAIFSNSSMMRKIRGSPADTGTLSMFPPHSGWREKSSVRRVSSAETLSNRSHTTLGE